MASLPRVVLSGGVSGGHTFPLLAVARALRTQFPQGIEFLFIGSKGHFESESMASEHIPATYVLTGKMRRYFSILNYVDMLKLPLGFLQSLWKLFVYMPDAVFAKGGSASVPVVLAAWVYRIPIVIHDSDAVAGRANRFLARFATRIAIAYPSAHAYFPEAKTALTGNPVREEILTGNAERASAKLGFSLDKPVLTVLGGSQGSTILNEAILHIVPELLQAGIQIVHQSGHENYETLLDVAKEHGLDQRGSGYVIRNFFAVTDLADILALSTLVLSRAGASSIAELAATKKAVILVPLASAANDEQRMNAYDIAKIGGAFVIEEQNLGEHLLLPKIVELINDASLRATMGERIYQFYHPDASLAIATGIRTLIDR